MTTAFERQVIAAPLAAYANANALPVEWPNKTFDKPPQGVVWVRFTVIDATGQQLEMGNAPNDQHRVYGSLILQVFAPADTGDAAALELSDALGKLYRQKVLNFPDTPPSGHVRMRDPNVRAIGRSGAYWQVNVTIPFHRDDIP